MRSGAVQVAAPHVRVWPPLQDEPISPSAFKRALYARRKALDDIQREAAAAVAAAAAAAAAAATATVKTSAVATSSGDPPTECESAEVVAEQPFAPSAPAHQPAVAAAVVTAADSTVPAKSDQRKERQKARRAAARVKLEATRDTKVQRKGELEQRQSSAEQQMETLKARLGTVEQEKHRLVGQLRQVLQAEGLQRRPSVVTLGGPGDMGQSPLSPMPGAFLHQQLGGAPTRTASTGAALAANLAIGASGAVLGSGPYEEGISPGSSHLQSSPFLGSHFGPVGSYGTPMTTDALGSAARTSVTGLTPGPSTTAASRFARSAQDEEDEGEIREDGEYGAGGTGPGPSAGVGLGHALGQGPLPGPGAGLGPGSGLGLAPGGLHGPGLNHGSGQGHGPGLSHGSGVGHGPGLNHGSGVGHGPGLSHGSGLAQGSGLGHNLVLGPGSGMGPSPGPGIGHVHGGPSPSPYVDPARRGVGGLFPESRPSPLQLPQSQMGVGMSGPASVGPGSAHAVQPQMRLGLGGRGVGGWAGPGSGPSPSFSGPGGLHPHHGLGPPLARGNGAFGGRMSGGGWRDDDMIGDGMPYGGYGRGRGMGGFPMQGPPRRNW